MKDKKTVFTISGVNNEVEECWRPRTGNVENYSVANGYYYDTGTIHNEKPIYSNGIFIVAWVPDEIMRGFFEYKWQLMRNIGDLPISEFPTGDTVPDSGNYIQYYSGSRGRDRVTLYHDF